MSIETLDFSMSEIENSGDGAQFGVYNYRYGNIFIINTDILPEPERINFPNHILDIAGNTSSAQKTNSSAFYRQFISSWASSVVLITFTMLCLVIMSSPLWMHKLSYSLAGENYLIKSFTEVILGFLGLVGVIVGIQVRASYKR